MQATFIAPHQLFYTHPAIARQRTIYLVCLDYFFKRLHFHRQKIFFHIATLSYYRSLLEKRGYNVVFLTEHEAPTIAHVCTRMQQDGVTVVHYAQLIERELEEELVAAARRMHIRLISYETPYFITAPTMLASFFDRPIKRFIMAHFYRLQRKELNVLIDISGQPIGKKWSYDQSNREPLPASIAIPTAYIPRSNMHTRHAHDWVATYYQENPGHIDSFMYPVTHTQAEAALEDFLQNRLRFFGPYQDAIRLSDDLLFHSRLSPLLNVGLLTPQNVLNTTLLYAQEHMVQLSSLEGFIRQLIGWREFVYGIYRYHGQIEQTMNYWGHERIMPDAFWTGTTGLAPVDAVIHKVMRTGYAHHIERLMILGNCMLLLEISPDQVYRWFMEFFIDAYDWVMVPNVYGMSQYADGGIFASKPYISSSTYLKKMGVPSDRSWTKPWDGLFWQFIAKHHAFFAQNGRMARTAALLQRMNTVTLERHKQHARQYSATLHMYSD